NQQPPAPANAGPTSTSTTSRTNGESRSMATRCLRNWSAWSSKRGVRKRMVFGWQS
ncbi:unnamed protein product, partial [Durusdinium trenchii]